jgi:hypothetical protein
VERTTIAGETEELGENLPQGHFVPPQIPNDQVRFRTPDCSGGKPATNRLSYGAAPSYDLDLFSNLTDNFATDNLCSSGYVTISKKFLILVFEFMASFERAMYGPFVSTIFFLPNSLVWLLD